MWAVRAPLREASSNVMQWQSVKVRMRGGWLAADTAAFRYAPGEIHAQAARHVVLPSFLRVASVSGAQPSRARLPPTRMGRAVQTQSKSDSVHQFSITNENEVLNSRAQLLALTRPGSTTQIGRRRLGANLGKLANSMDTRASTVKASQQACRKRNSFPYV